MAALNASTRQELMQKACPVSRKRCAVLSARHVLPRSCLGASRCGAPCAMELASAGYAFAMRRLGAPLPWFGECPGLGPHGAVRLSYGVRDGIAGLPFASIRG